jgi:hypothetical protein
MTGIPVDCITTAELCELVLANQPLLRKAKDVYEAAYPKEARLQKECIEATSGDGVERNYSPEQAALELRSNACANFVLDALSAGRIELHYRDEKTGERLRYDHSAFQSDGFALFDIRCGGAPLFAQAQEHTATPFISRDVAKAWIDWEFRSLASAPFPEGFVSIELVENRVDTYCRKKGDIAHGRTFGTDAFGNWTQRGHDEFKGRLRNQVHLHILKALQDGRIACEYWRADTGARISATKEEWGALDEHGIGKLRLRLHPNMQRLHDEGHMLDASVRFGTLIFERLGVERFLEDMAPRPAGETQPPRVALELAEQVQSAPTSARKKGRPRSSGSLAEKDARFVELIVSGLRSGEFISATKGAEKFAGDLPGVGTRESKIKRIARRVIARMQHERAE